MGKLFNVIILLNLLGLLVNGSLGHSGTCAGNISTDIYSRAGNHQVQCKPGLAYGSGLSLAGNKHVFTVEAHVPKLRNVE